ncbi:MAG: SpoIID/LytB domain-containing protein, partial [Acidobacteriota bacterium]|nr:SpoIID/LytB domain-containing protein [Acidobacteriota bacterium]
PRTAPARGALAVPDTIRVRHNGRVAHVPLDTYAAIVALSELAPGAEPAAVAGALYEAQIIVARTYAVSRRGRHGAEGFDLCDATHCQRYESARLDKARWAQAAQAIAARTRRQVLAYSGAPAEAVFHADCGGHSADSRDVWGTARPYLIAKPDTDGNPHRQWESTLAREAVLEALRADRRTRVDGPLRDLVITQKDRSGRAARIRIEGRTTLDVGGDVFRAVISAGLGIRALPSTRFSWTRGRDGWQVTGTGFGHGVGLCQAGALARARKGRTAAEILRFYYPGAIITTGAQR